MKTIVKIFICLNSIAILFLFVELFQYLYSTDIIFSENFQYFKYKSPFNFFIYDMFRLLLYLGAIYTGLRYFKKFDRKVLIVHLLLVLIIIALWARYYITWYKSGFDVMM